MLSLGEKLRRTRLEKGLEVAALATRLKISAKFLEAIESDRRDLVPAGFFFRNWTVQYARALSMDQAEIQADLDRILSVEAPLPLPGQVRPESKEGRWRPKIPALDATPRLLVSVFFLLVVLLACSGFYTWWHQEKLAREAYAISTPAPVDLPAPAKKTPAPVQHAAPSSQSSAQSPPVETATAHVVSAQSTDALLLELYAREQTWLVISPDGKQIFNGVLRANESKTVGARESARIKVGNAGGLDVRFNGKPVGELGPRGKVRVLLIGPDGVRIFQSRDAGESGNSPVAAIAHSETAFAFGGVEQSGPFRLTLEE